MSIYNHWYTDREFINRVLTREFYKRKVNINGIEFIYDKFLYSDEYITDKYIIQKFHKYKVRSDGEVISLQRNIDLNDDDGPLTVDVLCIHNNLISGILDTKFTTTFIYFSEGVQTYCSRKGDVDNLVVSGGYCRNELIGSWGFFRDNEFVLQHPIFMELEEFYNDCKTNPDNYRAWESRNMVELDYETSRELGLLSDEQHKIYEIIKEISI